MTQKQLAKKLEDCKVELAKQRDILRDLVSEAEELEASASEAVDYIELAADKLSELV